METLTPTPTAIQHVTKASSDQLLRKFAAIDSDSSDNDEASSSARKSISTRRRSQKKRKVMMKKEMSTSIENNSSSASASFKVVERKSLLPQYYQRGNSNTSRRTSSSSGASLLKKIGISKSHPSYARVARDFRTKSLLSAIEKVWEDKDQPRVHVVPAFTPYYAPQAETANAVPVLCVARNVACNVRGGFFK
ncbi:hypothetical protein BVRB_3g060220 isoform B [Beta vulgaris subsp. vulgaris]|nr:hypothetical protein BVRB_3g060220 isoform B [Beta vulgaris subsp. vulgaris]